MALEKRIVPVSLAAGEDAASDPKMPTSVIKAENATYDYDGAVRPRRDLEEVFDASDYATTIQGIYPAGGQVALATADEALILGPVGAGGYFAPIGSSMIASVEEAPLSVSAPGAYQWWESAENDDYVGVVYQTWESASGTNLYKVYFDVFDKNTLTRLDSKEVYSGSTLDMARLSNSDGAIVCYYFVSGTLTFVTVGGDGAISAASTVTGFTRTASAIFFDVVNLVEVSGPYDYTAVAAVNATGDFAVATFRSGVGATPGTADYTTTFAPVGTAVKISACCLGTSGGLATIANDSGTIRCRAWTLTLTAVAAEVTFTGTVLTPAAAIGIDATTAHVWHTEPSTLGSYDGHTLNKRVWNITAPSIGSATVVAPHACLWSKPIHRSQATLNNSDYAFGVVSMVPGENTASNAPFLQTGIYWMNADGVVIAKAPVAEQHTAPYHYTQNTYRSRDSASTVASPITQIVADIVSPPGETWTPGVQSLSRYRIDLFASKNLDYAELSSVTHIAGAIPREIDGQIVHESGFHQWPVIISATPGGSGSLTGTFSYAACFAWTDSRGRVHRSAPSTAFVQASPSADDYVTVLVSTLGITEKPGVLVELYRTKDNGTTYYLVGALKQTDTSLTVSFQDGATDATIGDNPQLYTTGGVTEAIQPQPMRAIAAWQSRLFYAPRKRGLLYYSRENIQGEGVAYNEIYAIEEPEEGGAVTALKEFQDKLIIFKERAIYAVDGQPLDDRGAGQGYGWPYQISNVVGARLARGVVEANGMLIFDSGEGQMWAIDSRLQLAPIGESIRLHRAGNPIKGVASIPDQHVVVLADTVQGYAYDWLRNKWSNWTGHSDWLVSIDGALWRADEGVVEKTSAAGARAAMVLETGWVPLAGLLGYQRCYQIAVLGQKHAATSGGTLTMKIAYNYDPYWVDSLVFDLDTLTAFDYSEYIGAGATSALKDQVPLLRAWPSRQKSAAIRIRLETSAGADVSLTSLALLCGVKRGVARVGTGRHF